MGYRQGIHELLAVIYIAANSSNHPLMPKKYLEHDTASIFFKIMPLVQHFYDFDPQRNSKFDSPVILACKRIQYDFLKSVDPELFQLMVSYKIESQLFLLRWLRLLFCREFPIDQTLLIWDHILANTHIPDTIEWLAVSMLVEIRSLLFEGDYVNAIQLLMKYPSTISAQVVIQNAKSLQHRYANPIIDSTNAHCNHIVEKLNQILKILRKIQIDHPSNDVKQARLEVESLLTYIKSNPDSPQTKSPDQLSEAFTNIKDKLLGAFVHSIPNIYDTSNAKNSTSKH
jgi:hypothetical protein